MTELFAALPPEQSAMQIRAHHAISTLLPLEVYSPSEYAEFTSARHAQIRGQVTADTVDHDVWATTDPYEWVAANPGTPWESVYSYDVIGDTPEQGAEHQTGFEGALRQFKELPEDAPVSLVINEFDAICGACTFQRHCQMRDPGNYDRKVARTLEDVVAFLKDGTRRPNEHPESDDPFATTAGELRSALSLVASIRGNLAKSGREVVEMMRESQQQNGNALATDELHAIALAEAERNRRK